MTKSWINKHFEIDGISVEVDQELHMTLCALSSKFYSILGYSSNADFDFSASEHPKEKEMYLMALTAYVFNNEVGFD